MPSSRARSSVDTVLIDIAPKPKPRAARKTATPPAVADVATELAVVQGKEAARKGARPAEVVAEPAAKKAAAKPVAPKKAAAKKVATKTVAAKKAAPTKTVAKTGGTKPATKTSQPEPVAPAAPTSAMAETRPARPARKRTARQVEAAEAEVLVQATSPGEGDGATTLVDAVPVILGEVGVPSAAEPTSPAVESPPEPELPLWSSVQLQADAWGQHLHWQAGQGCPRALQQRVQALMDGDGALDALNDEGLLALHQAALDAGHDLRIELPVWSAVAAGRDLRWRVHLLEQAYPEGAASAALQALWPAPAGRLAAFQWEGALFAACAGRSMLADDVTLAPAPQALAAAILLTRHFGVQRVLIVCPDARVLDWQRLLAGLSSLPHRLCGESVWRAEAAELTAWEPELVVVDDTAAWQAGQAPVGLRALDARYALVLMPEPDQRAQALADWLAWLDPQRLGVAREFMRRHRGAAGAWVGLDRLRDTLAPVMLRRTRSRWMQPVSGRRDRLIWVPMDGPTRAVQQAALAPMRAVVARWREVGYVSDQDQLVLREGLAAMRSACDAQSPAKREALEALGDSAGVVCAELPWPLSSPREVRAGQAAPATYLLTEGALDEHRLWLRCIEPRADDWLCDPALFRQGPALARRMDALGWLVDRCEDGRPGSGLRDMHHYSA